MSAMTCGLIFAAVCGGGFGALLGSVMGSTGWGLIIGAGLCMGFMWVSGRFGGGGGDGGSTYYGDFDGFDPD